MLRSLPLARVSSSRLHLGPADPRRLAQRRVGDRALSGAGGLEQHLGLAAVGERPERLLLGVLALRAIAEQPLERGDGLRVARQLLAERPGRAVAGALVLERLEQRAPRLGAAEVAERVGGAAAGRVGALLEQVDERRGRGLAPELREPVHRGVGEPVVAGAGGLEQEVLGARVGEARELADRRRAHLVVPVAVGGEQQRHRLGPLPARELAKRRGRDRRAARGGQLAERLVHVGAAQIAERRDHRALGGEAPLLRGLEQRLARVGVAERGERVRHAVHLAPVAEHLDQRLARLGRARACERLDHRVVVLAAGGRLGERLLGERAVALAEPAHRGAGELGVLPRGERGEQHRDLVAGEAGERLHRGEPERARPLLLHDADQRRARPRGPALAERAHRALLDRAARVLEQPEQHARRLVAPHRAEPVDRREPELAVALPRVLAERRGRLLAPRDPERLERGATHAQVLALARRGHERGDRLLAPDLPERGERLQPERLLGRARDQLLELLDRRLAPDAPELGDRREADAIVLRLAKQLEDRPLGGGAPAPAELVQEPDPLRVAPLAEPLPELLHRLPAHRGPLPLAQEPEPRGQREREHDHPEHPVPAPGPRERPDLVLGLGRSHLLPRAPLGHRSPRPATSYALRHGDLAAVLLGARTTSAYLVAAASFVKIDRPAKVT